ncbi:MAG: ribulose-phosphate 3-epimerase [Deltaproteobacteria bacterium]|nr:ribulose-phosphate 3-epimerase [Deltaproteobacteria bacterium]
MQKLIAPSILSADFANLEREIKAVQAAGADWLHLDVMDGHFVPNITIGPQVVAAIRKITTIPLDVHLMVANPELFIDDFIKAGSDILTVHLEATVHLHRLIEKIKSSQIKAGVSLNPATSLSQLDAIIDEVDLVLVMSVNPGFGGQVFIPSSLKKIRSLAGWRDRLRGDFVIEVDGGVNAANIKEIASTGADVLVAGSAIFHSENYAQTITKMRAEIS